VARSALVLAGLLLPVLLLEGIARIALDPPPPNALPGLLDNMVADDGLLWRNLPGYAPEDDLGPINSLGFRGREVSLEKPAGTMRILSLGESSTLGYRVRWDRTYSHLLEGELRSRGHQVQVLNAGVAAWTIVQSRRFLEAEIDRLDPDLVLVYHEVNDFLPTVWRPTDQPGAGLTDREMIALNTRRVPLLRLVRSSRFLTWASLSYARMKARQVLGSQRNGKGVDLLTDAPLPYERIRAQALSNRTDRFLWMDNPNELVRAPDADREASLRALVRLVRETGRRVVVFHPAYWVSVPHRCLLNRVCEEEGVPVLEIERLIQQAARDGRTRRDYFLDQFHPNDRGHAVLATGMADFLEDGGLLDERPGAD